MIYKRGADAPLFFVDSTIPGKEPSNLGKYFDVAIGKGFIPQNGAWNF
jgi:hypothetical protein